MADNTHETKIVISGDASGATSALKRVQDLVGKGLIGTLNGLREAVSKVMGAFGLFGLAVQGVQALIEGFKKIHEWMNRAATAAKALREELAKTKYDTQVAHAAASYEKLVKSLAEANRLEKERNDILAQRKAYERDIEDANAERNKQMEISRLDPNAKDYADWKKEIERKYEIAASDAKAARASEDVRAQSAALYRQADQKDAEARSRGDELRKQEAIVDAAVERRWKAAMEARNGGDAEKQKAKEADEEFNRQFDKAKKIREEIESTIREAQSLRNKAGELAGGNLAANLLNEANKRRIANEAAAEAAEKKRKESEDSERKAKDEADKKLQRDQNLEDKQLDRRREEELARLDPTSPTYERDKKEIERNYEIKAAETKRDRATNAEDRRAAEEELKTVQIRQDRERGEGIAAQTEAFVVKMATQADSSRPKDRLTAMGLGSGAAIDRTAQQQAADVKTLVQLLKEQVNLTREKNQANVAVYAP